MLDLANYFLETLSPTLVHCSSVFLLRPLSGEGAKCYSGCIKISIPRINVTTEGICIQKQGMPVAHIVVNQSLSCALHGACCML